MVKKKATDSGLEKQISKIALKIDKLMEMTHEEVRAVYDRLSSVEKRVTMVEGRLTDIEERLVRRLDEGFSRVERRIDGVVQTQLDEHAHRIKILETKTGAH